MRWMWRISFNVCSYIAFYLETFGEYRTAGDLLISSKTNKRQVIPLVVGFHPDLPHLTCILHQYQRVVDTSPQLKKALSRPPLVAYRRPPNLKDLLVWDAFSQTKETYTENSHCRQPSCKACAHIKMGTTFCSTTTSQTFRIKATMNCRTRNIVYFIP